MNLFSKKNWKTVRLGDVAVFNYGKSLVSSIRVNGEFPVYGSSGITGYHIQPLVADKGYIIGRKGSVGTVYFSEKSFWPIDTVYYVTEKDLKCDFNFFYYLLKILGLDKLNFDSAVPGLNRELAYSLEIKIPETLEEQKEIAVMLGSFDDKIELLRRENKILESVAQTLFKEWFVDFKFPGYEKIQFIDGLPEGWRVGKLGDVCINFDSKRVPLASDVRAKRKGLYPYYGATQIMDYVDDYLFDGTYLLLAEDASVMDDNGFPVLQYVEGQFWVSNHAHVLQGLNIYSTEMIYLLMRQTPVAGIVTGAVQLKINQENLFSLPVIISTKRISDLFNQVIIPQFEKLKVNRKEIQTLSKLRDGLLNKIFDI